MTDTDERIPDSPYWLGNLKDYPEELSLLVSISRPRECDAGEIIYVEGEESRPRFYLVESGKVKISLTKDDGSEKIIVIQEGNTLFGYASALDGHPSFHTATVLEQTRLRVIPIRDYLALAEKHPRLSFLLLSAFARVTRMLVLQIKDISFLDAQKRVAHIVCKLASEVGQPTRRGLLIAKKVTQEEIAGLTGLSRVSVSLALNHFEDMEIIRKKRHIIEVLDLERLREVVGGV